MHSRDWFWPIADKHEVKLDPSNLDTKHHVIYSKNLLVKFCYSLLLVACAIPGNSSSNAARKTSSTRFAKIKFISSWLITEQKTFTKKWVQLSFAISNSNPFPLFFSHLLSAISNSPLSRTQTHSPCACFSFIYYRLSRTVFRFTWEFDIAGFNCTM